MNRQLDGLDDVQGTYLFDVRASVNRLRINRFFFSLTRPENRERFRTDEQAAYREAGLSVEEIRLLTARDWPSPRDGFSRTSARQTLRPLPSPTRWSSGFKPPTPTC